MNTLQNMRIFVRVVETGSFTAAAESLEISPGSASRGITELEQHLRTRLLNRTTRRVALTAAGTGFFERCKDILTDIAKAEEEITRAAASPNGLLRVHSFVSFGQHYIIPAISEYRRRYPEVKIELRLSQSLPDLFDGTCDTSVLAVSSLPDSEVVMHRLGTTYSILCASPTYLAERGIPKQPKDLLTHDCLTLSTPTFSPREWVLEERDTAQTERLTIDSAVHVNIAESLAAAIRAGMGIGSLPVYAALEGLRDGSLVRVLPRHTLETKDICALYPSRRFLDAKTKTWTDFMRSCLPVSLERDLALLDALAIAPMQQTLAGRPLPGQKHGGLEANTALAD